ncbi:hypothetical protein [Burkholderia mayonis]|nr:hypothetical protein [Burkholderia mayonis]
MARTAGKNNDARLRAAQLPDDRRELHRDHRASPKLRSNRDSTPALSRAALESTHFSLAPIIELGIYACNAFDATLTQWESNPTEHQFQKTSTARTHSDKANATSGIESIKYSNHIILNPIFSQKDRTPLIAISKSR